MSSAQWIRAALFLFSLAAPAAAFGQSGSGVITGLVKDGTGAAVPGAPARGATPAPAAASPIGYPRAFAVTVSADGKKWSKPVAQGMGEGGHTTITFAPVRAQFVRITQTDNIAGAPPWSIRSLRVYESRPASGTR